VAPAPTVPFNSPRREGRLAVSGIPSLAVLVMAQYINSGM
jgi:hypothetical protein